MIHFLGEYELTLDSKGRFVLPAGFRKQLPENEPMSFVVNRGFETCLSFFPLTSWKTLEKKLNKLNDFNPKVRDFKRLFLNGATLLEIDSAGRVLLPKPLQEYAHFSSQGNKMEIWNKETYHQYIQSQSANLADLAHEVFGGEFINPFEEE